MSLRILHFSDVHLPFPEGAFRPPEMLHPKRLVALANFYLRRGSKYAEAAQKLNGGNELDAFFGFVPGVPAKNE